MSREPTSLLSGAALAICLTGLSLLTGCEQVDSDELSFVTGPEVKVSVEPFREPESDSVVVWGPEKFIHTSRYYTTYERAILISQHFFYEETFTIYVINGEADGTSRISDATVRVNGKTILGKTDFSKKLPVYAVNMALPSSFDMEVELKKERGCYLTILIAGKRKPLREPDPLSLLHAEDIFRQANPVFEYLAGTREGKYPVLPEGITAKYDCQADNARWSAILTFLDFTLDGGYSLNGTMQLISDREGNVETEPHQVSYTNEHQGELTAMTDNQTVDEYYFYDFFMQVDRWLHMPAYPDTTGLTTTTQYDFGNIRITINGYAVDPASILDMLGK